MDGGPKPIEVFEFDGALLKGLKLSLNYSVNKLKEAWKPSVFSRCFPSLAYDDKDLNAIRVTALEAVLEVLYANLSAGIEEELSEPLNELGGIIKKCSKDANSVAWRPSGNPDKDMIVHDMKILQHEKQKYVALLETQMRRRHDIIEKVKEGQLKCHSNHLEIQAKMQTISALQTVCDDFCTHELQGDIENILANNMT